MSQEHQGNRAGTDIDEESELSIDGDDDSRLTLVRSFSINALSLENRILEVELRSSDDVAARDEHDRAVANWMEHDAPWRTLCNKTQLNFRPIKTRADDCDNS